MALALGLYFLLLIFLSLTYISNLFFFLAFLVLISPLFFKENKDLGLNNFKKGAVFGFGLSVLYLPFIINKINLKDFAQSGQVFAEEIFFRGYLLNEIPIQNFHIKNIIISLLFIVPHLIINPSFLSILTFFPSLVFGYLYYFSNSVIAPFIFHLFSNLFFQLFLIHKL
ncbi:CPBP family glutamic-type intramembrane protease [Persephonella sp.]